MRGGDLTLTALLLEAGAHVDAIEGGTGNTALMLAANLGRVAIVELLLQAGANASLRAADGWTAAQAARMIGEEALARYLEAQRIR